MYGLASACKEEPVSVYFKVCKSDMNAPDILQHTLLPFIQCVYPDGHRFMQDNDPKHVSNMGKDFLDDNNITWWKAPPESPDLNPIENLWHELKRVPEEVSQAEDKR